MAKLLSRKQILELSEEEQKKYFETVEQKIKEEMLAQREKIKEEKKIVAKIEQAKKQKEEAKNRKKRTHALILFATDYIKTEQMLSVVYLEKMIETVTRETDKEDLKLLLKEVKNKK